MDFLDIRRKARERAAARARQGEAAGGKSPPPRRKPGAGRGRAPAGPPEVAAPGGGPGPGTPAGAGPSPAPGDDFVIVRGPPEPGPSGWPAEPGEPAPGAPPRAGAPSGGGAPPDDPLAEFFLGEGEAVPGSRESQPGEQPAEALRQVLVFRLGLEEYALEIATVREILKAPVIVEVPRAPSHVLGVTMVRGQVIPVYDPRRRLGLAPAKAGPGARVVVCDAGDGPVGLLVDGVSQVLRLPSSALESRPQGIAGVDSEFIAGVGRGDKRFFALLDTAALLRGGTAAGSAR